MVFAITLREIKAAALSPMASDPVSLRSEILRQDRKLSALGNGSVLDNFSRIEESIWDFRYYYADPGDSSELFSGGDWAQSEVDPILRDAPHPLLVDSDIEKFTLAMLLDKLVDKKVL